jgi:hypothetical protein
MFERTLTTQDLQWILPLTAVAIAIFILALRMCYDTFIKPKPPRPLRYQSTIDQYRRIPQVGDKPTFSKTDVKQYCIGLVIFLLIGMTGKAQVVVQGGAGITNKYFSAELQAGYRFQNTIPTIGYIALPDRSQPALFNIRINQVINERFVVYGGYVREHMSNEYKERNYNRWQVGGQLHFCKYDRGSFYTGATYTSGGFVSVHVGMGFNMVKELF